MSVGGSQKPPAKWWQSVNTGRNWLSLVKSKSTGQSIGEAVTKTHAKLNRSHVKD